ncbi:septation protein A [Candidatus Liberibacter sp.]|uniref:septation protein A n=1 Tax=Candidatus Liberibacter sp. TaxID=34022 RepID=UPI0015F52153|nr:septation protein A [Candidatus Liberibacter sp.]MBA5723950.1 septation protein A [Candidatus Liberibacter sp.]
MSSLSPKNQFVKFLVELGPLVVFFLSNAYGYKLTHHYPVLSQFGGSVFIATISLVLTTGISLGISWFWLREINIIPLLSGVGVLVFGALTIWFRDERFIKIKPTVFYLLLSSILFVGLAYGKSFLNIFLSQIICLDPDGWRKLTIRWAFFFLFLSLLNEMVWRNFSTQTWALFKMAGTFPITIIFSLAQMGLIKRHKPLAKDEND